MYAVDEIVKLMEAASRLGICLLMETDEGSVRIDGMRGAKGTGLPEPPMDTASPLAQCTSRAALGEHASQVVQSPIVGTFYASPTPEKPPFVSVGTAVKKGDVLFIIESMKLMNEVQSERDGVVREILVKSGDAVEFGQTILMLE